MKRVLITGGTGCIGAAAAYSLTQQGADEIVIVSRSGDPSRLRLWFGDDPDPRIKMVRGDLSDTVTARGWIGELQPTHIIHLGAFQSPDCDSNPTRGMEINVGGTMHMLNAAAELCPRLERFVVASSGAVYGARNLYNGPTIKEADAKLPPNLYGIWKVASEHLARLFHEKSGIPTVCLRLNTTYGKGRDAGKTSAPTRAMKTIAASHVSGETKPFRMPYAGRENYHYVGDVGAHFATVALAPFSGYGAFNIRGRTVEVAEFLALIKAVAARMGLEAATDLGIADDAESALFACDLDDTAIQKAFAGLPATPFEQGIQLSLEAFVEMAKAGTLGDI
jgi:nucleoside-diphosphate-sugar epimerase